MWIIFIAFYNKYAIPLIRFNQKCVTYQFNTYVILVQKFSLCLTSYFIRKINNQLATFYRMSYLQYLTVGDVEKIERNNVAKLIKTVSKFILENLNTFMICRKY